MGDLPPHTATSILLRHHVFFGAHWRPFLKKLGSPLNAKLRTYQVPRGGGTHSAYIGGEQHRRFYFRILCSSFPCPSCRVIFLFSAVGFSLLLLHNAGGWTADPTLSSSVRWGRRGGAYSPRGGEGFDRVRNASTHLFRPE